MAPEERGMARRHVKQAGENTTLTSLFSLDGSILIFNATVLTLISQRPDSGTSGFAKVPLNGLDLVS